MEEYTAIKCNFTQPVFRISLTFGPNSMETKFWIDKASSKSNDENDIQLMTNDTLNLKWRKPLIIICSQMSIPRYF